MLPGNSSMPVSKQLMPRMWLSPSPRTLLFRPLRTSMRFLNGASGFMIFFSSKSLPVASGQKFFGMVPLGLNITTSRCRRGVVAAKPRLGSPVMNGSAAVETPMSRMNCLRSRGFMIQFLSIGSAGSIPFRALMTAVSASKNCTLKPEATKSPRSRFRTPEP